MFNPIVREARKADSLVLARNNIQLALETEDKHLDEMGAIKGVEAVLDDPSRGFYLIVEETGRIIGQCLITSEWSDWRNGYFWWIQSVYVDRDWRGKATFTHLFERIHCLARERDDVVGLRLYVNRENSSARQVYARFGMNDSIYVMYEMDFSGSEGD